MSLCLAVPTAATLDEGPRGLPESTLAPLQIYSPAGTKIPAAMQIWEEMPCPRPSLVPLEMSTHLAWFGLSYSSTRPLSVPVVLCSLLPQDTQHMILPPLECSCPLPCLIA